MQGEIFDEMIENLTLQAQEQELINLKWIIIQQLILHLKYLKKI